VTSKHSERSRVPSEDPEDRFPSRLANWTTIPHVTHHNEPDITDLEQIRRLKSERRLGIKISLLAYIVKAIVQALVEHPKFNGSLDAAGENFIVKKCFNVGIAVDGKRVVRLS
jgi:pyruvate dehydrogenase E2 component (dihydrolipoamide acetyltransferase)